MQTLLLGGLIDQSLPTRRSALPADRQEAKAYVLTLLLLTLTSNFEVSGALHVCGCFECAMYDDVAPSLISFMAVFEVFRLESRIIGVFNQPLDDSITVDDIHSWSRYLRISSWPSCANHAADSSLRHPISVILAPSSRKA